MLQVQVELQYGTSITSDGEEDCISPPPYYRVREILGPLDEHEENMRRVSAILGPQRWDILGCVDDIMRSGWWASRAAPRSRRGCPVGSTKTRWVPDSCGLR